MEKTACITLSDLEDLHEDENARTVVSTSAAAGSISIEPEPAAAGSVSMEPA